MVEDFHITDDPSKISVYAGMVTSAFTLAEFATGVLWGRLSDKIGRKPVLLSGLAGTALSVLIFGFSPSLPVALFARALGGLLNGYVIRRKSLTCWLTRLKETLECCRQRSQSWLLSKNSSVSEDCHLVLSLCTNIVSSACLHYNAHGLVHWVSVTITQLSITRLISCRSIVGPMIGGALARPCISYPTVFSRGTIWDRYPYLLPNLFSAITVLFGVIVGLLFLDETHAAKKMQHDRGREIGNRIAALFRRASTCHGRSPEKASLLHHGDVVGYCSTESQRPKFGESDEDEPLPIYRSQENSPKLSPKSCPKSADSVDVQPVAAEKMKTFTKPVIMNIMSYGILAL